MCFDLEMTSQRYNICLVFQNIASSNNMYLHPEAHKYVLGEKVLKHPVQSRVLYSF